MSATQTFTCFGLVIHGFSLEELLRRIEERALNRQSSMVATTNPEILLAAKRDPAYWNSLRQADFRSVDGFGLQIAGWIKGARPKRVTGVVLSEAVLQLAVKHDWSIGLLGGDPGNADKSAWSIRKSYPSLRVFAEHGGKISRDGSMDEVGNEAVFRLTQQAPDILFVAFGHPRQEQWMVRHLTEIPSVKIAIGVGGTFEYWAGAIKRAPRMFQMLGIEWVWRLIQEPKRFGRIWNAVIVFPYEVIKELVEKS